MGEGRTNIYARKVVNGGSHGLARFADTYTKAMAAWAKVSRVPVGLVAKAATPPKPSRARLNVTPDPADLRDRPYLPRPRSLPEIYPAGWPWVITHPRLPQIRTCPIRASGSSA